MPSSAYNDAMRYYASKAIWLVELVLDRCGNDYTQAPCTATDLGDGKRCWYTYQTCQDRANYTEAGRTVSLVSAAHPFPDPSIPAYPLIHDVRPARQQVRPADLAVFGESVKVRCYRDFNPPPPDADKALYNTARVGEFWANLLSRNPYWVGRTLRLYHGFAVPGFTRADFLRIGPDYKLRSIRSDSRFVTIVAESTLKEMAKRRIPRPISEDNTIQTAIGASDTTITVLDGTEWPDPANFTADIVGEITDGSTTERVLVTAISGNDLTVTRGYDGTTAQSWPAGTSIRHIFLAHDGSTGNARTASEVLLDILKLAGVPDAEIDTASFDATRDNAYPDKIMKGYQRTPTDAAKLAQGIRETRNLVLYISESTGLWTLDTLAPLAPSTTVPEIYDDQIVDGSLKANEDTEERATRAVLYYDPTTDDPSGKSDFGKVVVMIDAELESARFVGEEAEKEITDQLLDPNADLATIRTLLGRYIGSRPRGLRTFKFRVTPREAVNLGIGQQFTLISRAAASRSGGAGSAPCAVIAKGIVNDSLWEIEALDLSFSGPYLRFGPDSMADDWANATAADKAFGYFGDPADNTLGPEKADGYTFW